MAGCCEASGVPLFQWGSQYASDTPVNSLESIMTDAISLQNVYKFFGSTPAVNDLSFTLKTGEMFGLLGLNGAGKSTTIRMLTTLTRPTKGSIQVAGYSVPEQAAQVKSKVGVVLQQMSLDGDLSAWESLEFHACLHHIPNPRRKQRIEHWLNYVQLADRRRDPVKTLSGGMKRRLQIARALLHEPEILFLDEPTVGLDPQTRRRLWEIISGLNEQGMTILLTTHYMEEAESLCNRIGIMSAGKLISLGTMDEFRQQHGQGLVERRTGDRWNHEFFPTLAKAQAYLEEQPNKTGLMVRPSNLEDIFVALTGYRLDS